MDLSVAAGLFSDDITRQVIDPGHTGNALISPLSLLTCLSMLLVGTKSNSRTELTKALHIPTNASQADIDNYYQTLMTTYKAMDKKDGQLLMNNMAIVSNQKKLLAEFESTVKSKYNAEVSSADFENKGFEVMGMVNRWVNSTTNGLIPILLEEPPKPETTLMLMNSIYFESPWFKKFDGPYQRKFYQSQNSVKNATFMSVNQRLGFAEVPYGQEGEVITMVAIPYRSEASMMLMMPPKSKTVNEMLHEKSMHKLISELDGSWHNKVDLHMPKFKFDVKAEMEKHFQKMGVVDMFEDEADLTGITGEGLKVDGITHATAIEVDEKGTKAAAVTAIRVVEITSVLPQIEVVIDRPFAFCIYDHQSNLPIFVGKLFDPSE